MGLVSWTVEKLASTEKLNPAQSLLSGGGTVEVVSQEPVYSYQECYERLEVVSRAVNMICDDVAAIQTTVGEPLTTVGGRGNVRKKTIDKLLNVEPNPFQDIDSFRRALIMDLILDGNIFIYFDGVHMYQLPAVRMSVVADAKNYVSHYEFDDQQRFSVDEIVHVKDNSYKSIYRGSSRLEPALRTMRIILEMRNFQDNFFKNGAVPGLVLTSENTLNDRVKKRIVDEWSKRYRPSQGGKRPALLDGGLKIDQISNTTFSDLDFENSITNCEQTVLKALGVPGVLLDGGVGTSSGGGTNLRPYHRIFYLETIVPILNKINAALSRFFGFEIYENTTYIEALRPELADQASYLQSLVNTGIMTPNEARDQLGMPPLDGHDDLRIPANIAGSAGNPSEGGRPPSKEDNGK